MDLKHKILISFQQLKIMRTQSIFVMGVAALAAVTATPILDANTAATLGVAKLAFVKGVAVASALSNAKNNGYSGGNRRNGGGRGGRGRGRGRGKRRRNKIRQNGYNNGYNAGYNAGLNQGTTYTTTTYSKPVHTTTYSQPTYTYSQPTYTTYSKPTTTYTSTYSQPSYTTYSKPTTTYVTSTYSRPTYTSSSYGHQIQKREVDSAQDDVIRQPVFEDQSYCAKLYICATNAKAVLTQPLSPIEESIINLYPGNQPIDLTAETPELQLAANVGFGVGPEQCEVTYAKCQVDLDVLSDIMEESFGLEEQNSVFVPIPMKDVEEQVATEE